MSAASLLAQGFAEGHALINEGIITQAKATAKDLPGVAATVGSLAPSPGEAVKNALTGGPNSLTGAAASVAESAGNLVGIPSASELAEGVTKDAIGLVKPIVSELFLYAVFILGGLALAGYGLATMLKPEPPSIRTGVRKAGEAAGLAAA
jgi:hypothetical protein